ncbi:MAG: quinol:cytochrome C oxidoreductase [Planctomycetota bacterium]
MGSHAKPTALFKALGDKLRIDDHAPDAIRHAGAMAWVAALLCALFAVFEPSSVRFWSAYLAAFCFLLSISLGGLFFVLIQHLTRAGWSVVVRRVAELIAANMVVVAVLFLPLIYPISKGYLQPAAKYGLSSEAVAHGAAAAGHEQAEHAAPAAHGEQAHGDEWTTGPHLPKAKHHTMASSKASWLSFWPFMGRMFGCFFIWILISRFYLGQSVAQDVSKDPAVTNRLQAFSALGVLLFALTTSLAAFDLLMALDPYWYSTMFGVYFFAGSFLSFFAALNLVLFLLRRKGVAGEAINPEHYQDTGKFMFAFTVFWAYIGFSQYMLIWYGNIPEETGWFFIRQQGGWLWISALLIVAHFVVPFLLVMSRWPKRQPALLALLSVYVLCVHFMDMFWLVQPQKCPLGVVPVPLMDIFLALTLVGVYAIALVKSMVGVNVIPTGDPRLIESVHFHNQ